MVYEHDEEARIFAQAQIRKHCLGRDDDICVEIWNSGSLERLVIAEEHEHISRKATEAKVKVAGFARRILIRKGLTEQVDLTSQRERVTRARC
jgi:hypothetical protein